MRTKALMGILQAFNMHSMNDLRQRKFSGVQSEKFPRPCLFCGKNHTHNNAFCSAEHARQWRSENPNQGRVFYKYTRKVNFSSTGNYGCSAESEDDVYTVAEFRRFCQKGWFIDYDGTGLPVKNRKACQEIMVKPSRLDTIPNGATHIVWFNR